VTNARIASFHVLLVVRMPTDHARSTPQNRALVTSCIRFMPQARRPSVCGSAAGYVLRSPNRRQKPDNPQTRARC